MVSLFLLAMLSLLRNQPLPGMMGVLAIFYKGMMRSSGHLRFMAAPFSLLLRTRLFVYGI